MPGAGLIPTVRVLPSPIRWLPKAVSAACTCLLWKPTSTPGAGLIPMPTSMPGAGLIPTLLPPLLLSSMNPFPAPAPSHALATPPDHLSDLPPLVGPVYAAHDGITLSRFQTQADFQAAFNAASREYEALLGNQQGHTHAQTIEALWAACNPEQPPTHIMGIGQRHDAIDRSVLLACRARASRRPHVSRTHPR
ncbi:hypothetical protein C8R43DRAFT_941756 [Mycena crocata]|nr:hypothetical protein C8R43DRAFT_941756 [Mycena crocata]